MITLHPKRHLSILTLLVVATVCTRCNNSADTSRKGTDSSTKTNQVDSAMPRDTSRMKADTMKMDTGATKPVKTTSKQ